MNEPPIISESGEVLGGNGLAMALQQAFAENQEETACYREALAVRSLLYSQSQTLQTNQGRRRL